MSRMASCLVVDSSSMLLHTARFPAARAYHTKRYTLTAFVLYGVGHCSYRLSARVPHLPAAKQTH